MSTSTDLIKIIDACCEVVERVDLQPENGETHCNLAVAIVALRLGYDKFRGLMANEIVDLMASSSEFQGIQLAEAQDLANQGRLVIAGEKSDPHGHVCIIRPGIEKPAGYWGRLTPMVANVGGINFIGRGLNFAFREIPHIWLWKG